MDLSIPKRVNLRSMHDWSQRVRSIDESLKDGRMPGLLINAPMGESCMSIVESLKDVS